jgi:hypothetical protein
MEEVNTILFIEHFKLIFYIYKHEYKMKTIKNTSSGPQKTYFWIIKYI